MITIPIEVFSLLVAASLVLVGEIIYVVASKKKRNMKVVVFPPKSWWPLSTMCNKRGCPNFIWEGGYCKEHYRDLLALTQNMPIKSEFQFNYQTPNPNSWKRDDNAEFIN